MFSCNPNCEISSFSIAEWITIFFGIVFVIFFTIILRKQAFDWNQIPAVSLKWHVPRYLFVLLTMSISTIPLCSVLFGKTLADIYMQFVLPEASIMVYLIWLGNSD